MRSTCNLRLQVLFATNGTNYTNEKTLLIRDIPRFWRDSRGKNEKRLLIRAIRVIRGK